MKPLPRTILVAIVLSFASTAATPVSNAGSKYFDQALRGLRDGTADDAATAADKGWAALLAAGPVSPGFLDGVYEASGIFATLGRGLRAEAVYTEAEALCATPHLRILSRRLEYIHIDYLIRFSEYVKAERILRASIAAEDRTAQKSSLYVAFVQSLAFIREQQNDLDGAEELYRSVIGYTAPDLSAVARHPGSPNNAFLSLATHAWALRFTTPVTAALERPKVYIASGLRRHLPMSKSESRTSDNSLVSSWRMDRRPRLWRYRNKLSGSEKHSL
ncbi:MAG TPA: hypothetical protein VNV82_03835 [Bryobacteraceae bacterium]|nr:hypothetical protein [Bryobacteraceae bacterium]